MGAPAEPAPARQIFLCGDLHNLGDLKLLLQNLALTQGRGGLVRRWVPLPNAIERQVEAAGGQLVPGRALLRFARRAFGAQLVLGGGQLVRDNVSLPSLAGLLLAVLSARLGGGGLVTRGLGVSRIRTWPRRVLWRAILRHCPVINVRDEASAQNAAALLPSKAVAVHADMVFLPTDSTATIGPGKDGDRFWIVVAPCVDESEGRTIEGDALDAAVEAALQVLPQARIVVACHDPRVDKAAAQRLAARFSARSSAGRTVEVIDGYELSALAALYRDAALVVTNRLHSLIFAILSDAPALAVEDGTAKVRVVADRFRIPVLPRDAAMAQRDVEAALGFDRDWRRQVRAELGRSAAGNLATR